MAVLKFKIQHQNRDQWCWAAVASSMCGFYQDQTAPTQCQLANQFLFPGEDCCQAGASDTCNTPFALSLVLNQLGHLVQPPRGVVAFEDLDQEINVNRQPVVVRITFSDQVTSHFVVVMGTAIEASGTQVLNIADPSQGTGSVTSMEYLTLRDDFKPGARWDETYFTAKEG
jgi:hypothetical protein